MTTDDSADFVYGLRVRWAECDPQGVVFNANYLLYLDVAFTEWMRRLLGDPVDLVTRGVDAVLGEVRVQFRAPARFDDEITVSLHVTRVGTTSLHSRFAISRSGTMLAVGSLRHVFVSPTTLAKSPIPAQARAAFEGSQGQGP